MISKSIAIKPGLLFAETVSGGTLMDVDADRFIALTPVSAMMWSYVATGHTVTEVIGKVAAVRGIDFESAEAFLASQLRSWERAELINIRHLPNALPIPKPCSPSPYTSELSMDAIQSAPLVPRLIVSLYIAELKYRRTLAKVGLARALMALQVERGRLAQPQDPVVHRTLRSYHASRRAYKQGGESRDCLVRSLALAAVLRRQGVDAELCIGIVDMPFTSHAWVEAGGCMLNDTLRQCHYYRIIGRF